MPIEAVSKMASCSRSRRATSSPWRRAVVTSSTIHTVPRRGSFSEIDLAMMRAMKVVPSFLFTSQSRSSCLPAESTGTAMRPSAS